MNWLHYLLQVNIYFAGFYGFYRLLLRKETFHQLNRSFLLSGTALAFFIPAMQSDWVRSWFVTQQFNESLYEFYNPDVVFIRPDYLDNYESAHPMAWGHFLAVVYLFGILFFLGKFSFQLMQLGDLIRYRYHRKADSQTAFAFFNHFFVGKNLSNRHTIEAHERVHVRQLHSADIIFFELVAVFNWFNPLVYFLKQDIRMLHEYLADEVASQCEDSRADYAMLLFKQQFGVNTPDLVHPFFDRSLLRSRILMLQKAPSKPSAIVKYALLLPVFAVMVFIATACSENGTSPEETSKDLLVATDSISAQHSLLYEDDQSDIKTIVDDAAQFPGGSEAMYEFLTDELKYPEAAQKAFVGGKVFVSFVVEKSGAISQIQVQRGMGFGCDEEAIRVLKKMPKWIPGKENGEVVRSRFTLPIMFVLKPPKGSQKS